MIQPIFWKNERLFIIDQTLLPHQYREIELKSVTEVEDAIRRLAVRGAPAIGIAAAYGLVIGLRACRDASTEEFFQILGELHGRLFATRPTAVNLGWALDRMRDLARQSRPRSSAEIWKILASEAQKIHAEDIESCQQIANHGAELIQKGQSILTHCNAGGLATGGLGTALGVLIQAHRDRKQIHVYVDETRPLLQGARLTTWELRQEGVPYTLCSDNMAAHLMGLGKIDGVVVGADRITANGDTANKIGTRGLAILAQYHHLPFYVAAPVSTIDSHLQSGDEIVIEYRAADEVTRLAGKPISPSDSPAINPAFDITPAALISAIITEKGILRPPFQLR